MSNTPASVSAEDAAAVRGAPQRIVEAWAANDADAFAAAFTEDGSMIIPGVHLTSGEQIRDFMKSAFVGPYKGTRVFGEPIGLRYLSGDVALLFTRGGVLAPGETEVAPERTIKATWVVVRQGSDWLVAAYQNTPFPA